MFKCSRAEIDEALTATCRMALVRLSITPAGYDVATSKESLRITVARHRFGFELRFGGSWREGKKGMLIKRVIAKQFEPVVPRIRIRLRQTR